MVRGKKGWIKVVEAFTALLIILGILLVIVGEDRVLKQDPSEQIYDRENLMIKKIQLNDSLRMEILNLQFLPINSEEANFPEGAKEIIANNSDGLVCIGNICESDSECIFDSEFETDEIYVQSGLIFVEKEDYNPKQIKIFCWED